MQPETLEGREILHDLHVGSRRIINNVTPDYLSWDKPHFSNFSNSPDH